MGTWCGDTALKVWGHGVGTLHSRYGDMVWGHCTQGVGTQGMLLSSQSEELVDQVKEHRLLISDVQNSMDQTMFITGSKDNSAKVTSHVM